MGFEFRDQSDDMIRGDTVKRLREISPELDGVIRRFIEPISKEKFSTVLNYLRATGLGMDEVSKLDQETLKNSLFKYYADRMSSGYSVDDYSNLIGFKTFSDEEQQQIKRALFADENSRYVSANLSAIGIKAKDLTEKEKQRAFNDAIKEHHEAKDAILVLTQRLLFTKEDMVSCANIYIKDKIRAAGQDGTALKNVVEVASSLQVDLNDIIDVDNLILRLGKDNLKEINMNALVKLLGDRAPERAKVSVFMRTKKWVTEGSSIGFPMMKKPRSSSSIGRMENTRVAGGYGHPLTVKDVKKLKPPKVDWKAIIKEGLTSAYDIERRLIRIDLHLYDLSPIPQDEKYQQMNRAMIEDAGDLLEAVCIKFPDATQAFIRLEGEWGKLVLEDRPDLRDRYLKRIREGYHKLGEEGVPFLNNLARSDEMKDKRWGMDTPIRSHGEFTALILSGIGMI